ncbi:MAG: hypothetical protein ACFFDN_15385 [Candidatus Hodarchaeota archaeon]
MATYRTVQESALYPLYSQLKCDICDSTEITETQEGYVCRGCGIVLEIQKLQYDRPYNEDLIQYAKSLGKTQVGTKRERVVSPNSMKLYRLNKHNLITDNEKAVVDKARIEISRILGRLNLSDYSSIKDMAMKRFKMVRTEFKPGSKYRNIEKLSSIVIYYCLKIRNISINASDLVEVSKISKKEFNDFNMQVQRYFPEYAERDRQKYVIQRILEVTEHFELGMPFFHLAKKILHRLWNGIKNTTDNAVAGLVSSISVLCSCKGQVSISAICKRLGIRMSTVQHQVSKKIFDRFRVEGFISLIKSSDLLVKIMKKLGLIGKNKTEVQEEVVTADHVEIVFGNVVRVFNNHDNFDDYYFASRGVGNTALIITVRVNESPLDFESYKYHKEPQTNGLLDFDLYRYYRSKDPPLLET